MKKNEYILVDYPIVPNSGDWIQILKDQWYYFLLLNNNLILKKFTF